ncbi:MAG: sugar transferase [Boseongicola sp.]|nr:MAG: sugar transferase [Boseongicola sp.]
MTVHVTNVVDPTAANVDSIPVRSHVKRFGLYRMGFKRVLDISLILITAPFVVPFMLLVSLLIATDGHSPLFRQERVGKDSRRFTMWKFRTMVPDAEMLLEDHLEQNPTDRAEWDSKQKLASDPRCTRMGRIIRRISLDELPQLLNVLTGDMSLVGPRPMMPSQQSLYPGRSYYNLRPGLTGSWQVSKRNESEFSERAEYDDRYDMTLSIWTDIKILFQTVAVVVRGTGY